MLVGLDSLLPMHRSAEEVVQRTQRSIETFLTFEQKIKETSPPTFTYEEAKSKLISGICALFLFSLLNAQLNAC